mmetsp:Transcript_5799/g.9255  ORF Transcript_5799/g.9255 Transcript_5799/m.9255 type:complete len:91 (+) Transcript_5799:33-305(+)|eukprot:CAMPEP_0170479946 /NCGR_PEP_ID=MMETSP0208-20121228/974_1 /TAXON_ID=197538 /ORGANISM="Strombidium inclinatum, Strain S3" /LENGTH=90 /DNA_ID=CAMNT_0010752411 /DNA_START=9 /DNA_END=281 /DNA_ORIENTATION=+
MDDDFDILYMVKTPFFMGNLPKAQEECEAQAGEIQLDDTTNLVKKNLLMVRVLMEQSKFPKLKEHMHQMMQFQNQGKDVQSISVLISYLA